MSVSEGYRAGFAHILGKANVGKSTFINSVVGSKVTVTSDKPQTTRNRIRCIHTTDSYQIVFLDTPGLHKPEGELGKHLSREAEKALGGSDVLVYMVEPRGDISEYDRKLLDKLRNVEAPRILLVNKIDAYSKADTADTLHLYGKEDLFEEYVPISALKGTNVDLATRKIAEHLPQGPRLFPPETNTDRPVEFLISEYVREKVYRLTYEEVPYSVAVETVKVAKRSDRDIVDVYVNIYVARDSQKGILIGQGGQMIKRIGKRAREDIERFLGTDVYLDLEVKVRKNWHKDRKAIEFFSDR